MSTETAKNHMTDSGKENLKKAILVQARLIAELRKEVDMLKASKATKAQQAKRVSIRN